MNDIKITINVYNNRAKELSDYYDTYDRSGDIKRVFSYIKKPNPRVLEIGCGGGRDAVEILKYTKDYIGMDISSNMLDLAKSRLPNAVFELGDINTYNLPLNIDIIYSSASLLHSNKNVVKNVLKRCHRVLNIDGIVYISLKYGTYKKIIKKDRFGERLFYLYTPEDIKKLALSMYQAIYEDTQTIEHTKWFTLVLRKV